MGWGADISEHPQYVALMKAFRLFDKNKDGFIDAGELRELLSRGGNTDTKGSAMSDGDVQALISSFDDNGDGKLSIEELVAAWVTIGGGDEDLDAAIREKRATKEAEAKAAIEKKKKMAAQLDEQKKAGEEARLKDKRNLTGQSQAQKDDVELQEQKVVQIAKQEAEEETKAAIAAGDTSQAGYVSQYLEDADKPQTAAERAREAAAKKVGKAAPKAGQGTLSGDKAAADPANMTAAERAKLKAKEEFAAKEAKKKAAKEAKKAAAAQGA